MAKNPNAAMVGVTPIGLCNWPHVFTPRVVQKTQRNGKMEDKEEYSIQLLVEKDDPALDAIVKAVKFVAREANDGKPPAGWHNPVDSAKEFVTKRREWEKDDPTRIPLNEAYDGKLVFNLKTTQTKPEVVDNRKKPLTDPLDIQSGDLVRCAFTAKWFSVSGKQGVTLYLGSVQKIESGTPISGGKAASSELFDEVEVAPAELDLPEDDEPF